MYKRIVLAYDGTQSGQQLLLDREELVQWRAAQLWLAAVLPVPPNPEAIDYGNYLPDISVRDMHRVETVLALGLHHIRHEGYAVKGEILIGESVQEITHFAQQVDANLIVVGHNHQDDWTARWWKGTHSDALIAHAPCSVLFAITPGVRQQMIQEVDL